MSVLVTVNMCVYAQGSTVRDSLRYLPLLETERSLCVIAVGQDMCF